MLFLIAKSLFIAHFDENKMNMQKIFIASVAGVSLSSKRKIRLGLTEKRILIGKKEEAERAYSKNSSSTSTPTREKQRLASSGFPILTFMP